jgi:hypothetical protein
MSWHIYALKLAAPVRRVSVGQLLNFLTTSTHFGYRSNVKIQPDDPLPRPNFHASAGENARNKVTPNRLKKIWEAME